MVRQEEYYLGNYSAELAIKPKKEQVFVVPAPKGVGNLEAICMIGEPCAGGQIIGVYDPRTGKFY